MAYESAKKDALTHAGRAGAAAAIRNAPTRLMKELHYGEGYQYAHDTEEKLTDMQCLPDSLQGKEYYRPTDQGLESKFKARLAQIKDWKYKRRSARKPEQP